MNELVHALKVHAASMDAQAGQPRWGTVSSYDNTRHMAKVTLQPEGVLTGWLPIATPTYGNNWGVVAPLEPGQQVICIPDNGDHDNPVILGGTWNTQAAVPQIPSSMGGQANNLQSGEWAVVSSAGSFMRFCADGSVLLSATALYILAQTIYSLGAAGSTPLRLATETFVLDVYNNHTHNGGATPTPQATSADLTTNLKAS